MMGMMGNTVLRMDWITQKTQKLALIKMIPVSPLSKSPVLLVMFDRHPMMMTAPLIPPITTLR